MHPSYPTIKLQHPQPLHGARDELRLFVLTVMAVFHRVWHVTATNRWGVEIATIQRILLFQTIVQNVYNSVTSSCPRWSYLHVLCALFQIGYVYFSFELPPTVMLDIIILLTFNLLLNDTFNFCLHLLSSFPYFV